MKKLLFIVPNIMLSCMAIEPWIIITILLIPTIFIVGSSIYLYIIRNKTTFNLLHKSLLFIISLITIPFGFIILIPIFFLLKYQYKQKSNIQNYIESLIVTLLTVLILTLFQIFA